METEVAPAKCENCGDHIVMLDADAMREATPTLPEGARLVELKAEVQRKDGSTLLAWVVARNEGGFTCPGCGRVNVFRTQGDPDSN